MDERFEYPLPILSVSTDWLTIETRDKHEGRFTVKNTGGSVLSGHILSRTRSITFEPYEWEGNEAVITYRFTPSAADGWKPGDTMETCAIICSNGGEKTIHISIKLTRMALATPENFVIANIRDFYAYAMKNPVHARRLFVDSDFYMLLLATGYEYTDAYELLHKDMNRDRALDNFFILSGLKKKTSLSIPQRIIEYRRKPGETSMIYDHFLVEKSDAGFFEAPISTKSGAVWLNLSTERLISSDFNEANTAMVKFAIDPLRIKGRYAREQIFIGKTADAETPVSDTSDTDSTGVVELVFKRMEPLNVRLEREAFRYEDQGTILVTNNTGSDLSLEVFCQDTYVRFNARKYYVNDRYEIPFEIKLTTLMSAQLLFRKLPFMKTVIEIRASWRDQVIRKKLQLTVGEW